MVVATGTNGNGGGKEIGCRKSEDDRPHDLVVWIGTIIFGITCWWWGWNHIAPKYFHQLPSVYYKIGWFDWLAFFVVCRGFKTAFFGYRSGR